MGNTRADLIRLLEAELDFIEGGGYGRPAGEPAPDQPFFYHSLVCIDHWLVPGHEGGCHDDCVLLGAVPGTYRTEELPCHFIPLNEAGDTVKSLESEGDRERLEQAVKTWLRTTIKRLKDGEDPLGSLDVKY
jgi:hypothetical protein